MSFNYRAMQVAAMSRWLADRPVLDAVYIWPHTSAGSPDCGAMLLERVVS